MDARYTYCGSDVRALEPVVVEERPEGERTHVDQFCNYACLSAFIDERELAVGAPCEFDP